MRWIGLTTTLLVMTACPAGDDGGNGNDTTGAPTTGGPEPTTATSTEDTTGTSTTMGGGTASCEDARTEAECDALSAQTYGCDWLLTRHVAIGAGGTCEDLNMAGGRCLQIEEESGCGDLTSETCPDSFATVFYDPLTVGEASIEILVAPEGVCLGGLPGWEICTYDPESAGDTGTGTTGDASTSGGLETAWDPPECRCGCL